MRNTILLFLSFSLCSLLGQSRILDLEQRKVKAAIFDSTSHLGYRIADFEGRFTPTDDNIKVAEKLLQNFEYLNHKVIKKGYRQYLGYKVNGSHYLFNHVIMYKCEKQFKRDFIDWEDTFEQIFVEPDAEQLSYMYKVNLDENMIGY